MHRRQFAAALTAAIAVPPVLAATPAQAAGAGGGGPAGVAGAAGARGLAHHMLPVLARELGDRTAAKELVPHLLDVGFDWEPETAPLAAVDFVVAYGFGNRPAVGGGDPATTLPEPGPVNAELAATVARIRAARNVPVYAQWEIARFLEAEHGMTDVVAIEPVIAPDGTITYLSTDGVAAQVAEARRHLPGGIGTACVVGFRDHHKRCVQTTRDRGMRAYAPRGVAMPHAYDAESGQPWTRSRDLYLVHDMAAQWQVIRAKLIAAAWPHG